ACPTRLPAFMRTAPPVLARLFLKILVCSSNFGFDNAAGLLKVPPPWTRAWGSEKIAPPSSASLLSKRAFATDASMSPNKCKAPPPLPVALLFEKRLLEIFAVQFLAPNPHRKLTAPLPALRRDDCTLELLENVLRTISST